MLSTFDTSVNLNRNAGGIVCTHCSVSGNVYKTLRYICVNMRVCEPGGLGGVEAAVLRLHEEGEGRSVLGVGQARVLPEGGH